MAKIKTKKKKIANKDIKISTRKIRDECDAIDDQVEDKDVDTHGDPCVDIYS